MGPILDLELDVNEKTQSIITFFGSLEGESPQSQKSNLNKSKLT